MPSPDVCRVHGILYDASGDVRANVRITIRRTVKSGVLVSTRPVDYRTNDDGELVDSDGVTLGIPFLRDSVAHVDASAVGLDTRPGTGVALTVPDAATANIEDLVPATSTAIPGVSQSTFNAHTELVAGPATLGHVMVPAENIDEDGLLIFPTVSQEIVQDHLSTFFPDAAPFDWTYDDAGNRVQLSISNATTLASGLMSAADKSALDAVPSALTTLSAAVTALGTALDTEEAARIAADALLVPQTRTVNGHALSANVTVTKSDVGLGNVDNTSDANKPVSIAQAAADLLRERWALNFTGNGDIYIPAREAMTVDVGVAAIGTGTLAYAKSTTAAPSTFNATTLPATLEAGAWLKVTVSGLSGFKVVELRRTA